MNRILVAFDGPHFSQATLNFVRRLNEMQPVLVKGLFLPEVDYARLYSYSAGGMAGAYPILVARDEDTVCVQKNMDQFRKFCADNQIASELREALTELPFPELKKETRFADLLVLSSELFYEDMGAIQPNEFLHEALHLSECPVLLVPENDDFPQTNILTYDGSEASVFAIKQFAKLFPGLCDRRTLLVFVKNEPGPEFPDEQHIRELVSSHFPDMTLMKLHFTSKKNFNAWLGQEKRAILVSGAFGRSAFSNLLRKSFIAEIIAEHKLPLFVAHP
jgi:hypothetical protein